MFERSTKVILYLSAMVSVFCAGICICWGITALKYDIVIEPAYSFFPAWTTSPILQIICGVFSLIIGGIIFLHMALDIMNE